MKHNITKPMTAYLSDKYKDETIKKKNHVLLVEILEVLIRLESKLDNLIDNEVMKQPRKEIQSGWTLWNQ